MDDGFSYSSWENFWEFWEDLIEEFPDAKRIALHEIGKAGLQEVMHQINRTGVNDRHGRVKRWQEIRMGTRGGYVAISPSGDQVEASTATARDITRYLERGHGIRKPSGRAQRYVPRVKSGRLYVPGHQFYSWAKSRVEKIATEEAGKVLEQLADALDEARYGNG